MKIAGAAAVGLAVILLVLHVRGSSLSQLETEIAAANAAARESMPSSLSSARSLVVSQDGMRSGDCITTDLFLRPQSINVVPCSEEWEFHILTSFALPEGLEYPGTGRLDRLAKERCDHNALLGVWPSESDWNCGSRVVRYVIMADSFRVPSVGACYGSSEREVEWFDVVDCSSAHVFEAFHVANLPDGEYPGDFRAACPTWLDSYLGADYRGPTTNVLALGPSEVTWQLLGDRTIRCYLHRDFELMSGGIANR